MTDGARDWKIFFGDGSQHYRLADLPAPPPWRFPRRWRGLERPSDLSLDSEAERAAPFLPSGPMILAVNTALYLRRPLLVTGQPGTGKSTLIAKVAHELMLGPVLRWPIGSRSTVRGGVYEYDAVGRLQASKEGDPPVERYLTLGPLGTALMAQTWPRALLIDEIDKSDLDFANDLLNVIEEGKYEIPELHRLGKEEVVVRDHDRRLVTVRNGGLECGQFPFVVMTSNGEREFPSPFLRRCVRLTIKPPGREELADIVRSHLRHHAARLDEVAVDKLIDEFLEKREAGGDLATDQLLNAIFLTLAMPDPGKRTFDEDEIKSLRKELLRQLSGPEA